MPGPKASVYFIGVRAGKFLHTKPGDSGLEAALGPAPRRAPSSSLDGRLLAPLPRGYREDGASALLKGSLAPFSRRWVTRAARLRVFPSPPPPPGGLRGWAVGRCANSGASSHTGGTSKPRTAQFVQQAPWLSGQSAWPTCQETRVRSPVVATFWDRIQVSALQQSAPRKPQ